MENDRNTVSATGRREPEGELAREEAVQAALLLRLWAAQLARRAAEVAQLEARLLAASERVRALGGQALASPAAFLPPRRRARRPGPPRRPRP